MKSKVILLLFIFLFLNVKSQVNKTTFGLQYKPIIPNGYFKSNNLIRNLDNYEFNLNTRYSYSYGMVIRYEINKTFSTESGLNYIQRNFSLDINNNIDLDDITIFGLRSYELPVQLLAYVQTTKKWYLNASFGTSYNILASNIFSYGEKDQNYFQNTYRQNEKYWALLANLGMEYRTEKNGNYYIGTSLHRPWKVIGRIIPEYNNTALSINEEKEFSLNLVGNFITLDLRYFFSK